MTVRRKRVVLKKPSKGACRTCRNRRVKCDETRPSCQTCALAGRRCDGFPPGTSLRSTGSSIQPLKPAITSSSTTGAIFADESIQRQLSIFDSSLTRAERGAFHHFVHETASPLQLIIPATDWTNYALQLSSQVPAVFHAITAVGSVTDITRIFDHTLHRPEPPFTQVTALQQYSKATSALQKYIHGAVGNQASIDPVLLCCILFSIFETIQLSSSVALSHLRFGIAAFEFSRKNKVSNEEKATLKANSQQTAEELLSIFCRLNAESTDSGCPRLTVPHNESTLHQRSALSLPTVFATVEQAKDALDVITNASQQVANDLVRLAEGGLASLAQYTSSRQSIQYCMACCASRAIPLSSSAPLLVLKDELRHAHAQWSYNVSRLEEHESSRRLDLMRFQHFLSFFKLATCRATREQETEFLQENFEAMLDLVVRCCRGYEPSPVSNDTSPIDTNVRGKLDRRNVHWPSNTQNSFSLEHAILPVLFLICFKSRSARTRQRSLLLLDTIGRREGIYWSGELAVYAQALISLEEQRARNIKSCEKDSEIYPIPEAAMFSDVVIEGLGYHEIRVICGRFRHESDMELEIVEHGGVGAPPLHLDPLKVMALPSPEGLI